MALASYFLSDYIKGICVHPCRELEPEIIKFFNVYFTREHLGIESCTVFQIEFCCNWSAFIVIHLRTWTIYAHRVFTVSVHEDTVCHILNCTGPDKRLNCIDSHFREVCNIDKHIVSVSNVSAPNRETDIIADIQANIHSI